MCQAIRRILLGARYKEEWSKRAAAETDQALKEAGCVAQDRLVVEVDTDKGRMVWWTFAAVIANSLLAETFSSCASRRDNLSITVSKALHPVAFRRQLDG